MFGFFKLLIHPCLNEQALIFSLGLHFISVCQHIVKPFHFQIIEESGISTVYNCKAEDSHQYQTCHFFY